jgi:hypothetical protein
MTEARWNRKKRTTFADDVCWDRSDLVLPNHHCSSSTAISALVAPSRTARRSMWVQTLGALDEAELSDDEDNEFCLPSCSTIDRSHKTAP